MKKILIGLFIMIGLFVVDLGSYEGQLLIIRKHAERYLADELQVPKGELIFQNQQELKSAVYLTYTTKQDFESWQEAVRKHGENLNGEKIPASELKKVLANPDNCEMSYNTGFTFAKPNYIFPFYIIDYFFNRNNEERWGIGLSFHGTTVFDGVPNRKYPLSRNLEGAKVQLSEYFHYLPRDAELKEDLDQVYEVEHY